MYECIRGGDRYVYGGIGDGEVHRDPGVVMGDLVGVVGGVSRSDGRCAGSAQSSGARGLWSGVSMKRVAGVLVVVVEGVRGVLEMVGGVVLGVAGVWVVAVVVGGVVVVVVVVEVVVERVCRFPLRCR